MVDATSFLSLGIVTAVSFGRVPTHQWYWSWTLTMACVVEALLIAGAQHGAPPGVRS